MNNRVSTKLPFSRKCFMSTVPFGNEKSPSAPTEMLVWSGIASHRSFVAPSDQNGAATSYGIRPAAGWLGFDADTHPVAESCVGTGGPPGAPPASTTLYRPPP